MHVRSDRSRTATSPRLVRRRPTAERRGATLIEMMIVMTILVVAAGIFSRMVIATDQLRTVNRENTLASNAARDVLEEMRDNPFDKIFALYNPDPSDDPDGPGTAPGNLFTVEGLRPLETSATGFQLEVVMPELPPGSPSQLGGTEWDRSSETTSTSSTTTTTTTSGGKLGSTGTLSGGSTGGSTTTEPVGTTWELREDYQNEALGLPRDLNGDSMIDCADHAQDYIVLPILIRVEWQGPNGPRVFEMHTMLTEYIKS